MDCQLPSKATELLSARRAPVVKYDHTACGGGLSSLSCQRLLADKEMHILDNIFKLSTR